MRAAKKHDRRMTIGGSEVAAVLGLSPWQSPLDVYMRKIGEQPEQEPTDAMRWGCLLEDLVAREWADRNDRNIERCNHALLHDALPISAHLDRLVLPPGKHRRALVGNKLANGTEILEVKTARSAANWGESGGDEIPLYYQTQVQTYLGITGAEVCHVAVLISGSDYRQYVIRRDDEVIERMFREVSDWWQRHVVQRVAPPPRTADEALAMFPSSTDRRVVATVEAERAARRLAELHNELATLNAEADACRATICREMADAEMLIAPDGTELVSWRSTKPRMSLDRGKLAEKLGDLSPYMAESKSVRQFLVKVKQIEEKAGA